MKPKPQYSIGLRRLFAPPSCSDRFAFALIPMGPENMDFSGIMSLDAYNTEKEARDAAKHFVERNDLILYKQKDDCPTN